MKALDYIFIGCFGFAAMMLSHDLLGIKWLSILLGIMAIIYSFIAVKEEKEG